MTAQNFVRGLSQNDLLTVVARIVMVMSVPVSGAFLYFSGDWINSHVTMPIAETRVHIEEVAKSNEAQDKIIERHDILLSANRDNIAAERSDVKELGAKVDNLATSLNGLVEVLKDRDRRSNMGTPQ